jgi:phospholipid/cholesterol/gamma-HCH transport system substrate-binding protein
MAQPPLNPAERERRLIVRAGLFVGLALVLAGVVVFLIGKERNLFDKENTYRGAFENVDGLALDSPVRLGGLEAGHVTAISFASDLEDKRIIVTMQVLKRYESRVRADSVARVVGRGVLGDKAIDVSLGSPDKAQLANGSEIPTGTSGDISSLLKATGEMIDNAVGITRDLRSGVQAYTAPDIQKDVVSLVKSARNIMHEVETGKNLLHLIAYDQGTSDEVKKLVTAASASAVKLDEAVGRVDALVGDVKNGDGSLHALVYDRKVASAITSLGVAADELATLVHDVKTTKTGAVYQLVYGDAAAMVNDLGQAASDVKAITGKIKAGQGSLGAVINDPTVYEDLKEILGNIKRNRVLRELVRLSISNAEKLEGVGKPKDPPPR